MKNKFFQNLKKPYLIAEIGVNHVEWENHSSYKKMKN